MDRPVFLGTMGGPKVGKTHFAATVFDSVHFPPDRVLYFDNHGSTDPFNLPQWSRQTPWGVKHIPADKPGELVKELSEVRKQRARGRTLYDIIVIDDWSEFAQTDIENRLSDEEDGKIPRHWRDHGEAMRDAVRLVHPRILGAHHLAVFQAAQLPDPFEARPKKVVEGEAKYVSDTRKTFIQPVLQGGFATWLPYKLDAVFYQYFTNVGGKLEFKMKFTPKGDIHVISRWLHLWANTPKLPTEMVDPTGDKVVALLGVAQVEKKASEEKHD